MTAAVVLMIGLAAGSVGAQGRGRFDPRSQGIPPGQMPPPGECRVWYDNVPPGRQPAPTSCEAAERVASRSRNARVIYGSGWEGDRRWGTRAIPRYPADVRRAPYPNRYPGSYPGSRGAGGYASVAFANGFEDGWDKGREDGDDGDAYNPERHGRFRSADHGYDDDYGWTRDEYREVYRDGFLSGYDEGFRQEAFDRRR